MRWINETGWYDRIIKAPLHWEKKQKQTYLDNLDKKPKKYFYSGF